MDMNHHHKLPATWVSLDHHITMDQNHDHDHNHGHALHFNSNHHQQQLDSIWHSYTLQTHELPPLPSSSNHNHHHHHQHQLPIAEVVSFGDNNNNNDLIGEEEDDQEEEEELGAMKEMMYKIASMQPVDIDPSTIRKPKRRNVRISDDPQSIAARHRRERISEKIRILQRLVPGGTKMDTASMLDEAIRYAKFLKRQIRILQSTTNNNQHQPPCINVSNGEWSWPTLLSHKPISAQATNFTLAGAVDSVETLCFNHEVIND